MKNISKNEFMRFVSWLVTNGYKKMPKGLDAMFAYSMFKYENKDK